MLATSKDGINWRSNEEPIIEPTLREEKKGGCGDLRLFKINGRYILTYTAYNGRLARLCIAVSRNLKDWTKYGSILPTFRWTKSGAILPTKINEKYWMYFGESNIWIATSEDLIDWSASKKDIILRPRRNRFDSRLVEPGSPSIVTDDYILLIYNSANYDFTYHVAWAAFSKDDPTKLIARAETPLLSPEFKWELEGQVDNVWFAEGLVYLDDIWYLYFGGTEHILDLQKLKLRH